MFTNSRPCGVGSTVDARLIRINPQVAVRDAQMSHPKAARAVADRKVKEFNGLASPWLSL